LEYLETNGKAVKPDVIPLDEVHNSTKHYFTAVDCPVTLSRELRSPQDGGSTVHIEVDISKADKSKLSYQTADNLGVLPVNDDSVVEAVANALGYDLNAVFRIQSAPGHDRQGALFPTPCTVRDCLARYCDLTSPPRRSELKLLASYAKDPLDQKALLRMASKEGKAEYKEKITGAQIGLVDIVSRLCKSIEAPLEHFITLAPRLQTRFYTISSSSSVHPNSIHATVSVLGNKRKDGSVFKGVCSNHLAGIAKNGMVRVFCRDSTFRLPSDVSIYYTAA
jgi:NADPH-ferrihemoprotein reductase